MEQEIQNKGKEEGEHQSKSEIKAFKINMIMWIVYEQTEKQTVTECIKKRQPTI